MREQTERRMKGKMEKIHKKKYVESRAGTFATKSWFLCMFGTIMFITEVDIKQRVYLCRLYTSR